MTSIGIKVNGWVRNPTFDTGWAVVIDIVNTIGIVIEIFS